MRTTITPNLWFDGNAEEAVAFYTSVFPNSRVTTTTHYPAGSPGPEGAVMTVEFELDGHRFVAINGGPEFTFSEAVSFLIECDTQEEIDRWWAVLTEGGEEGPCGWLKDRFGLSWQVAPRGMDEVFADEDKSKAERAFAAMMTMKKLDLEALRRAAEGAPA
jgi:predicted 3-demethylubiquinone-9 3-methyltransferase (glyoxalase superfamily)